MTNEQLAEFIQQGENDELIPILWEKVKSLLYIKSEHFYNAHKDQCRQCGVELWDIRQAAYIAFLSAVRGYKPDSGFKFASFLKYPMQNEINRLLGIKTSRTETLNTCSSLNRTIGSGEDSCELAELVADDSAVDCEELAERNDEAEIIRAAVEALPERLQCVIRLYFFEGIKLEDIAQRLEITPQRARQLKEKALRELRRNSKLRNLWSEQRQHYSWLRISRFRYSPDYYEVCKRAEEKRLSYGYRQAALYSAMCESESIK